MAAGPTGRRRSQGACSAPWRSRSHECGYEAVHGPVIGGHGLTSAVVAQILLQALAPPSVVVGQDYLVNQCAGAVLAAGPGWANLSDLFIFS